MSDFRVFKFASENIIINAFWYEGESDACDDNNIGCVLIYRAIVQFI